MEHLVGDYLIIRVLKDKAYSPRLLGLADSVERFAEKQHLALGLAMVGKACLESAQERTLSAAAGSADKRDPALGYRQRYIVERRLILVWICKAQIADLKRRHTRASFASKSCGKKHRSANAAIPSAGMPPKPLIITDGK